MDEPTMPFDEQVRRYTHAISDMARIFEVELSDADRQDVAEMARRILRNRGWVGGPRPSVAPLPSLYPAERDANGRLRWDTTGRWVDLRDF